MVIDASNLSYIEINDLIKSSKEEVIIKNLVNGKYIGTGIKNKKIIIKGNVEREIGINLENTEIIIEGNCEDAIGDKMNSGKIVVNGSVVDAPGYSMNGGKIYIKENAGYRVGIYMKELQSDEKSVIIVGGNVGDFLGQSQEGGTIIVLGLQKYGGNPVGRYCATDLKGGHIYIRSNFKPKDLDNNIILEELSNGFEIQEHLIDFSKEFNINYEELVNSKYFKISSKL